MRVLIENYRGWEVFFDTGNEEFYTISNQYDNDKTKKSYAAAIKYIDDYIKENSVFKPIKVQNTSGTIITLIGIRKDKAFMYETQNGDKRQLSTYDEKDYFVVDSANDSIFSEISELEEKREELRLKIKELLNKLVRKTVPQIKEEILA